MSGHTDFLARLVSTLQRAHVPYMIAGSVGSGFYGRPRATNDIDIVIDDIKLLKEILNFNIFAYLQQWLIAITGLPLEIVFWIAIGILVFILISVFGGFISVLKIFI